MNAIKLLAETPESVTVSRSDWAALLAELENAEDRAAVRQRRADEVSRGKEAARRDYLTANEAMRLLGGESPVRVWREKRGLSQRQLASGANVSPSYLAEIETGRKPGSPDAITKIAQMLDVPKEDLMTELQQIRAPEFGPVILRRWPNSAGVSPGNRGAGPEVTEFSTVRDALAHVRRDWRSIRNHGVFIETMDGQVIHDLESLYAENDPEVSEILREQAKR